MKIFLDKGKGKKHRLIKRMEPYWNKWGHEITWDKEGCDIQMCFIYRETKTNLPIVLRLDGIYQNVLRKNKDISKVHQIADGIIYQSVFCQDMCEKFLEPRREDAIHKIIYNGMEPMSPRRLHVSNPNEVHIIATSRWRRWKRLREITKVFKIAQGIIRQPSYLHIFGRTYDFKEPENPKIIFYGQLDNDIVLNYYLKGDIFIHLAKNDWCPNTVVEALAYGMPVLHSSAGGGTKELVRIANWGQEPVAGLEIDEGHGECKEKFDPYSEEWNRMPKDVMEQAATKLAKMCEPPRKRPIFPKDLHIKNTAEQYIKLMKRILGEEDDEEQEEKSHWKRWTSLQEWVKKETTKFFYRN